MALRDVSAGVTSYSQAPSWASLFLRGIMILDDPMGRMRKFEWSHEPQENRNHLIAHSGEGHAYRSWALIQYKMRLQACELASLGPCSGPLDKHHVISRAAMRGAAEARRFAEEVHPEVFLAEVCKGHH